MSIVRIGQFTGNVERLEDLKEFLISIIPIIQSSQGCQAVHLYQSHENKTQFTMIEIWDSIESHQASVKNIPSEKLAEIRPLLGAAPSGGYYDWISAG